jgi:V-type H+-transporting ATPase subunit C
MATTDGKTFWLVACGSRDSSEEILQTIKGTCDSMSDPAFPCQIFDVPQTLKFGSFDSLVKLTDDLAKYDSQTESVLRRIERQLLELNPAAEMKVISQRTQQSWESYLRKFKWDDAKFPRSHKSIQDNLSLLLSSVNRLDEEVRNKSSVFAELKSQATNMFKKDTATLVTKDLIDVLTPGTVSETDFVKTEHIITVCVIVPRGQDKDFIESYERMESNVVPMSAKQFPGCTDKDGNTLWRVMLFPSSLEGFKKGCREKKFTVRDFEYSAAKYDEMVQQRSTLEAELKKQEAFLKRVCAAAFSDTFVSWMHLKAMRVFVESTLRFGVPSNFYAFMVKPAKGKAKKYRTALDGLFGASGLYGAQYNQSATAEQEGGEDYFAYVSLNLIPVTGGVS